MKKAGATRNLLASINSELGKLGLKPLYLAVTENEIIQGRGLRAFQVLFDSPSFMGIITNGVGKAVFHGSPKNKTTQELATLAISNSEVVVVGSQEKDDERKGRALAKLLGRKDLLDGGLRITNILYNGCSVADVIAQVIADRAFRLRTKN